MDWTSQNHLIPGCQVQCFVCPPTSWRKGLEKVQVLHRRVLLARRLIQEVKVQFFFVLQQARFHLLRQCVVGKAVKPFVDEYEEPVFLWVGHLKFLHALLQHLGHPCIWLGGQGPRVHLQLFEGDCDEVLGSETTSRQ